MWVPSDCDSVKFFFLDNELFSLCLCNFFNECQTFMQNDRDLSKYYFTPGKGHTSYQANNVKV